MKDNYECIVIGGGVAGSTAAYQLATLGYDVAIMEKANGPHHKVCGEFLSFEALLDLQEMGVVLTSDNPVIKYFRLSSPRSEAGFTFPWPGRGVSRFYLDEELLKKAKTAGAHMFRGVCVTDYYKKEDGTVELQTTAGRFSTPHLFVATGKHDCGYRHRRQGRDHSHMGIKSHLRSKSGNGHGPFSQTMNLFSFPGGYAGICPVAADKINFSFIIEKPLYKSCGGNFEAVVRYLRRVNPFLSAALGAAELAEPACAVGQIPYGFLRPGRETDHNIYYLGDQRTVMPSLTGDGMATALRTAKDCVYEFHASRKGLSMSQEPMQKVLRRQMHWAFMAHKVLKSPRLTELFLWAARHYPFVMETFFNKTRIVHPKEFTHDHDPALFPYNHSGR